MTLVLIAVAGFVFRLVNTSQHYRSRWRRIHLHYNRGNEVGDLQELLRIVWGIMTPAQRAQFEADDKVREIVTFGEPGE
jgi:hypothetical protein